MRLKRVNVCAAAVGKGSRRGSEILVCWLAGLVELAGHVFDNSHVWGWNCVMVQIALPCGGVGVWRVMRPCARA